MDESRWLILRDLDVFPPPFHTSILCQRDLSVEIIQGQKERRHEWVIDAWSGKSFGRRGSGRYRKWSTVPPAGMARSPLKNPEPEKMVVVYVTLSKYFGLRIGRMTYNGMWEIFADSVGDWVSIPVGYLEGWLPLP